MKPDIWMPLYIGDYLADTQHFGHSSHGIYLLLIMAYWKKRGPLDEDEFVSIGGTGDAKVLKKFTAEKVNGNTYYRHSRIDKELKRAIKKQEELSKRGKAGADARWNDAQAMPKQCLSNAQAMPKNAPSPSPSPSDVQNSSVCIGEVELPIGFPKSKDEAGTASAFVGCPVEFAHKVWEKAMSRNGRDSKDVPIRQWRFFLSSSWKYEQEQQSKDEQVNEKSRRVSTRGSRVTPNYANGF